MAREVVLITGESGVLGSAAAKRLAERYDVVGFDRTPPKTLGPLAEHFHLDLTSEESVASAVRHVRAVYGDRVASVLHLAAYYDFSGEPSPLYDEVTVRGTARLLAGLQSLRVEQFVFSSSMLVHAPCEPGERITEDSPLLPKWDYPKSKVETERLLRETRSGIPVVILRIAGVYDELCHSIPISHQIQRIRERKLVSRVFPGDVSHGQAFVHADDVAEAFALAIERRAALPEELVLLIGEPETLSYNEIQRTVARSLHGETWETRAIPKALAKAGAWLQDQVPGEEPFIKPWMIDLADDHYALDVSRARRALGWEPRRSLRATLPRMLQALKADPVAWYRENRLVSPPDDLRAAPRAAGGEAEA